MKAKINMIAGTGLLGLLLTFQQAAQAGIQIGDQNTSLRLALLFQGWAQFSEGQAPDGVSLDTDFYLRRVRLLLSGRLGNKVSFFVETDNPNLGKRGDYSSHTMIQDAWVEVKLHPVMQIDAGMLLVPFSHHGMQGAVSLNSLDYHGALIRYPRNSHINWRDFGVMLRGMLLKKVIEYRLAILNGVHGSPPEDLRNPRDWPRVAARLTVNLLEAEGGPGVSGFFYNGIYLKESEAGLISSRKVLSLGVSVDWQRDLNVRLPEAGQNIQRKDYQALAADLFFDFPLDGQRRLGLTGQVNLLFYDYGNASTLYHNGNDSDFVNNHTGYGLLSEVGLRYGVYEILASLDWFQATRTTNDQGDLLTFYGGLVWWWSGQNTNLKLELGASLRDHGDWQPVGRLQVQLLF